MTRPGSRNWRHLLAPTVWAAIALAVNAALWAPMDTDPELSPLSLTVSDFAALDRGGPIETGMALLGVASLLLLAGMARALPVRGLPSVLLAVWGLGLVVAAVVPTDALTTDLSGSAYVHRYASVTAFVALPAAALLLARRLGPGERRARSIRVLGWAALAGAAVMACSANLGDRELIGLAERALLGCEMVLLGVLALYARAPRAAGPVLPVMPGRREAPEGERLATRGRAGKR
ncbi:DUF998 domain-containing protein [Streptomyces seoulensis]|uniref:DUF998 domain-containing protein n=1 Tax=Streptomyces seoulensis TaxID=73044 RepID=UPI001FCAE66D|nr:DUF998 domain-containing protein [Streptomyces seoulensis]BDH06854.1 hypothetical protein HEK131_40810 [Streptomyces seoulensis]